MDDLLNVARLEAGMLGLAVRPTEVGEVARREVGAHRDGDGRHATPSCSSSATSSSWTRTRTGSRRSSGISSTTPSSSRRTGGTVTVSARRRTDTVEVRVTDEGVGLAPAERQRIFTKFFRGRRAAGDGTPGTGLGLFLARGLVGAMGGRIWVESEEGEGSTFAFELPVSKSRPAGKA